MKSVFGAVGTDYVYLLDQDGEVGKKDEFLPIRYDVEAFLSSWEIRWTAIIPPRWTINR